MPKMPPKPCTQPMCNKFAIKNGRCADHKHEHRWGNKKTDRGTGWNWHREKAVILKRDGYLCQSCLNRNLVVGAKHVDHIKPLSRGGTNEHSNLQSLCLQCHDEKSRIETGASFNAIRTPSCEVILVTGPPGAGKTTYCKERMTKADTLIDLDMIIEDLSRKKRKDVDKSQWVQAANAERNKRLDDLHSKYNGRAWVIASLPRRTDRKKWEDKLKPTETVILKPDDPYTCISRINKDDTRSEEEKTQGEEVVIYWYSTHTI